MSQTKAQLIDAVDGSIVTADLADDAVTAAKLASNAVVNASVDASAAIAGSKISPDFGSQAVTTTGSITGNNINANSGLDISIASGTQSAIFPNSSQVNGITGMPSQAGTPFIVGKDTGTNRSAIFAGNVTGLGDIICDSDSSKFKAGLSADLELFHNGSHSFVKTNTGTLYLQGVSNLSLIANNKDVILGIVDAEVRLFHNNVKKFETTSTGVAVTGEVTIPDGSATGNRLAIGDAQDLALYHNGSNSFIADRGTGPLYIRGNNAVRIESWTSDSSGEPMVIANSDGAVELYYDGTKEFETASNGIAVSSDNAVVNIVSNATGTSTSFIQFRGYRIVADVGRLGELQFINQRDGDVQAEMEVIANGDTNSYFDFKTNNAGLRTFRVQHDGTHIPDGLFAKFGDSNDMQMGHNTFNYITYTGASFQITGDSTNDILLRPRSNETAAIFEPNGAVKLYYDNVLKLETTSDGTKTSGEIKQTSADGNSTFKRNVYYLAIPTNSTKTITLTSLNGTAVFRAGGYTNAGQGALALHVLLGGAMFATQHYQVNELINSGMQNTSISTSKNSTSYTMAITNSSNTFSLILQIYLESTGTAVGYAVS